MFQCADTGVTGACHRGDGCAADGSRASETSRPIEWRSGATGGAGIGFDGGCFADRPMEARNALKMTLWRTAWRP